MRLHLNWTFFFLVWFFHSFVFPNTIDQLKRRNNVALASRCQEQLPGWPSPTGPNPSPSLEAQGSVALGPEALGS